MGRSRKKEEYGENKRDLRPKGKPREPYKRLKRSVEEWLESEEEEDDDLELILHMDD